MPPRKVVNVSPPPVVVRKKKIHQTPNGAPRKNAEAPLSATPAQRPTPTPAAKPSPPLLRSARSVASPAQAQPQPVAPGSEATPTQPNHRQREAQAQRELLEVLRARWPLVFPQAPHLIRPLMRGIHQEIAKFLPGTSLSRLKRTIVLFQRLSGDAYWQAVLNGGPRYALDGSPCGEVLPQEQEHARQTLARGKKQQAAERQATPR